MMEFFVQLFGQPIEIEITEDMYEEKENSDLYHLFPPGLYKGYFAGQDKKDLIHKHFFYLYDCNNIFVNLQANWWRGSDSQNIRRILASHRFVGESYENYVSKKDILKLVNIMLPTIDNTQVKLHDLIEKLREI